MVRQGQAEGEGRISLCRTLPNWRDSEFPSRDFFLLNKTRPVPSIIDSVFPSIRQGYHASFTFSRGALHMITAATFSSTGIEMYSIPQTSGFTI